MSNINNIKSEQLGMPFSTASGRLRKEVMFMLVKKCNLDTCFKCGKKIDDISQLSIEHKIPWLHSDNPSELFFDLDNISFSHLSCNISTARVPKSRRKNKEFLSNNLSKSGYLGVYIHPDKRKKYQAKLWINGKNKSLGYYITAKEACLVVDKVLIELHGENVTTNASMGLI